MSSKLKTVLHALTYGRRVNVESIGELEEGSSQSIYIDLQQT